MHLGKRTAIYSLLALVLLLIVATSGAHSEPSPPLVQGQELVFAGRELAVGGTLADLQSTADGLTLAGRSSGSFTSSALAAPLPFSDLGALWTAELPAGATAALELRTSPDGASWTPWRPVETDSDLAGPEDKEVMGNLVSVPQSDRTHKFVQYRWTLTSAPDGKSPVIQQLRLAFIDAGATPPDISSQSTSSSASLTSAYPKPAVVSRTAWGCPDGQNSPEWPPTYEPVTHIIVHHTVTSNTDTDHYARVRAIWYYHAISRGWGDIGYNYLVARDGTLFEGRAGGDDVVGGHAYPYNPGSMGVSFMGDFSSAPVPQLMIDSMAELLAWKADQKGINPQGWGWLHDRWIRRISGHRDVSQTACPGQVLYGQLPLLRDETSSNLEAFNYRFVDEVDDSLPLPQFVKSAAPNWYDSPSGCGYDGHAYWTFSTSSPAGSTNWAWWYPDLPQAGLYRVYAYVPYCVNGYSDSSGVSYKVRHAGGDTTVSVNQSATAGSWVELGLFQFNDNGQEYVYLTDLAVDDYRTVWFDTVKWYYDPDGGSGTLPPNNLVPANPSWSKTRPVTFRWSASLTPGVDHYWLRIATDPNLSNLLKSDQVDYANQDYVYTFPADYPQVYWGVQAHGPAGYSATSGPSRLGVDTVAPTAGVAAVYTYPDGHYSVHWSGSDATSGIASYEVEYKVGSGGTWTPWLTGTSQTGATYPNPVTTTVYFRVRATDKAGNTGAFDAGTASTAGAILLDHQVWFTLIMRNWPPNP